MIDIQDNRIRFRRYIAKIFERRAEGLIALANSLFLQPGVLNVFERKVPMVVMGRKVEGSYLKCGY